VLFRSYELTYIIMEKSGYPIELFKCDSEDARKKLEDDYGCCICQCILKNPMQCLGGDVFCNDCIRTWLRNHKTCPTCRAPLTVLKLANNRKLRDQIRELKIICPKYDQNNIADSCAWVGSVDDLEQHVSNTCPSTLIECPNKGCKIEIQRRHTVEHLESCGHTAITCSTCSIVYKRRHMEKHSRWCCRLHSVVVELQQALALTSIVNASFNDKVRKEILTVILVSENSAEVRRKRLRSADTSIEADIDRSMERSLQAFTNCKQLIQEIPESDLKFIGSVCGCCDAVYDLLRVHRKQDSIANLRVLGSGLNVVGLLSELHLRIDDIKFEKSKLLTPESSSFIELVVSILGLHGVTNADIASSGCTAICSMLPCFSVDRFGAFGTCEVIVAILNEHSNANAELAVLGCLAMINLIAPYSDNKAKFVAAGACEVVMTMLRDHGNTHARVAECGCKAIGKLATSSKTRTRFGDAEACEVLVQLILSHGTGDVISAACFAIGKLIQAHMGNRNRLVRAGAKDVLARAGRGDAALEERVRVLLDELNTFFVE